MKNHLPQTTTEESREIKNKEIKMFGTLPDTYIHMHIYLHIQIYKKSQVVECDILKIGSNNILSSKLHKI